MENDIVINLDLRRKQTEVRDAERQAIVEEIIKRIDATILDLSDGSKEKAARMARKAVLIVLARALCFESDLRPFEVSEEFYEVSLIVQNVGYEVLFGKGKYSEPIRYWVWMQVAKHFVENAAIPFDTQLKEFDRNN